MEITLAPVKYIRDPGVLGQAGSLTQALGDSAMLIGGKTALAKTQAELTASLETTGIEVLAAEWYGGECSWANIDRLAGIASKLKPAFLVGIGGGKALDTTKAVACRCALPVVTVPTIAATCAAWTQLSIIYSAAGVYQEASRRSAVPALVLVDPALIAAAPPRYLTAGMGDTLAKWYETDTAYQKAPRTAATMAARSLAQLCREMVAEYGVDARRMAETGRTDPALLHVIDAIIAVSGMVSDLGGDECAAAGAHPVAAGLSGLAAAHRMLHGELVAFGVLCQVVLEGKPAAEIEAVITTNRRLGLPVTLAELGIEALTAEDLAAVAAIALQAEEIHNLPFTVTAAMLIEAIVRADVLGRV